MKYLWLMNFKIYYGHSEIIKIGNELYSKLDKCNTKYIEGKRQQKAVSHCFLKAFKTLSVM